MYVVSKQLMQLKHRHECCVKNTFQGERSQMLCLSQHTPSAIFVMQHGGRRSLDFVFSKMAFPTSASHLFGYTTTCIIY